MISSIILNFVHAYASLTNCTYETDIIVISNITILISQKLFYILFSHSYDNKIIIISWFVIIFMWNAQVQYKLKLKYFDSITNKIFYLFYLIFIN